MRERDIVLFGATGFTGGLTAEYLARHAPDGLRWALAGRRAGRLAAVRNRLAAIDPGLAGLELLEADVTDDGSLRPVVSEYDWRDINRVGPKLRGRQIAGKAVFHIEQK